MGAGHSNERRIAALIYSIKCLYRVSASIYYRRQLRDLPEDTV